MQRSIFVILAVLLAPPAAAQAPAAPARPQIQTTKVEGTDGVYIFRNGETYERRRPDVDACATAWSTDPATFELVDAKPFVLAGQGPWTDEFKAAIRDALTAAAGNGG